MYVLTLMDPLRQRFGRKSLLGLALLLSLVFFVGLVHMVSADHVHHVCPVSGWVTGFLVVVFRAVLFAPAATGAVCAFVSTAPSHRLLISRGRAPPIYPL